MAHLLDYYQVFGWHWEMKSNEWIAFLAGFGSILLTFMAGAEIEPSILRRFYKEILSIGIAGFTAPFVGALLYAYYVIGWQWEAALICGIVLSETSVAVVYAVMVETGLNETDFGKRILAACFVTDLGTVVALGACFARYDWTLLSFVVVTAIVLCLAPRFIGWFFNRFSTHVSEPSIKIIFFILFTLGLLATKSKSEAVLPAYMVGLVLANVLAQQRDAVRRLRTTVFAFLTPFYFLNAGMKVYAPALWTGLGLIATLLLVKLLAKFVGVWPLTRLFRFGTREGNYTTMLMSTGLTFGTISALFGLNNGFIGKEQYSILVTVVIGSAIVSTTIAQTFFKPHLEPPVILDAVASVLVAIPTAETDGIVVKSSPQSSVQSREVRD